MGERAASDPWPFGLLQRSAYRVIYCDPPWQFRGHTSAGVPQRRGEQHYQTMTLDEMKALPVADLAHPNGCALLAWSTSSHTPQLFDLAAAWGFTFSSKAFTWAKLNKFHENVGDDARKLLPVMDEKHWKLGMGFGTRRNTEDCWLFIRGKVVRRDAGVRELIVSPLREHSRKPDEAYERIERLFDGPRCELFARSSADGWASWGNETGKFDEG